MSDMGIISGGFVIVVGLLGWIGKWLFNWFFETLEKKVSIEEFEKYKKLNEDNISRREVYEIITGRIDTQFSLIEQKTAFISKCIVAIAQQLNIKTPLE